MDVRVKTFATEVAARFAYLCEDLGFVGPEVDNREYTYPLVMWLRYRSRSALVEVSLVLTYGGEEYVATTLVVEHPDRPTESSEIGHNTAHTGFQMRRGLDHQAAALRQRLAQRPT